MVYEMLRQYTVQACRGKRNPIANRGELVIWLPDARVSDVLVYLEGMRGPWLPRPRKCGTFRTVGATRVIGEIGREDIEAYIDAKAFAEGTFRFR